MTVMDDAVTTLRRYREDPLVIDERGIPATNDNYAYVLAQLVIQQVGLPLAWTRPLAGELVRRAGVRTLTQIPEGQQVMECTHPECSQPATLHGDQGQVCHDHLAWIRPKRPCICDPEPTSAYGHHPDCPHWVVPPHDIEELFKP